MGAPKYMEFPSRALCGALLCMALGALSACGEEQAAAQPDAHAAVTKRSVRTVAVDLHSMSRTVQVQGSLAPKDQVVVSTRVAGYLGSISVDLGSVVHAGDVIAQLEPRDFRLGVDQARAAVGQARAALGLEPDGKGEQVDIDHSSNVRQMQATLDQARADLERAKALRERKLIAPADFDATQASFLRAEAALQSARDDMRTRAALLRQRGSELSIAEKQLTDSAIRSPLDGVVSLKSASAGEFLPAAAPVATIVDIDPLRMRVEIPERDATSIQLDQPLRVKVDGDTQSYEGKIARVSPALSAQTRTLTVEGEIPNPAGKLRAGAFARAEIVIAEEDVLAVPESALVVFAGIEKVLGVDGGKIVELPIKSGRRANGFIEVLSGVERGRRVLVAPGNLQQGEAVDVRD